MGEWMGVHESNPQFIVSMISNLYGKNIHQTVIHQSTELEELYVECLTEFTICLYQQQ